MRPGGSHRAVAIVTPFLARLAAGYVGAMGAGLLVFGRSVFVTGSPPNLCVSLGFLASAVLALVRGGNSRAALAVVAGNALLRAGLAWVDGWPRAFTDPAGAVVVGAGLVLIAVIYDELARSGLRLGKFLLMGPLLAGLQLAVIPLLGVGEPEQQMFAPTLYLLFLGLLIGDTIGLAVELIELLPLPASETAPSPHGIG